jgi:light-regulated signal transduction histidine kinase (bacteriophytochrome)
VLEIQGNPMPGGGFVTSFSEITAYKRAQRALQESNETLEVRVVQRTRELTDLNVELAEAKVAAERANHAKTRFLAAASHDLVQPLTAARLFMSSLDRDQLSSPVASVVSQAESALIAGENLLGGLLDISGLMGARKRFTQSTSSSVASSNRSPPSSSCSRAREGFDCEPRIAIMSSILTRNYCGGCCKTFFLMQCDIHDADVSSSAVDAAARL